MRKFPENKTTIYIFHVTDHGRHDPFEEFLGRCGPVGAVLTVFRESSFLSAMLYKGHFQDLFVGHPQARETIKDGQYESAVRERVNLTPMPGRPEVNRLT